MTNAVNFCLLQERLSNPKHDTSDGQIWQKPTPVTCVVILQLSPEKGNAQSEVSMGILLSSYRPTSRSSSLTASFFFYSLLAFILTQPKRNVATPLVCTSLPQQVEYKRLKRKMKVAPEKLASRCNMCIYVKPLIQLTSTQATVTLLREYSGGRELTCSENCPGGTTANGVK